MANLDLLAAVMPAGNTWTVVVLGNAGQEFGLALYSEADDLLSMIAKGVDDPTAFHDLQGRVISLDFAPGAECHKAMRREVAAAGWEVAGPRAYPRVFAINTPAGGLRRRDAADLTALLGAVPRFVEAHGPAVTEGVVVEGWRDRESDVVVSYRAEQAVAAAFADLSLPLAPGRAVGPGADPEAALAEIWTEVEEPALEDRELAVVERFGRHLAGREGLSPATVAKHSPGSGRGRTPRIPASTARARSRRSARSGSARAGSATWPSSWPLTRLLGANAECPQRRLPTSPPILR